MREPTIKPRRDAGAAIIDYARLESGVAELRRAFQTAEPWQHVVIDGFLSDDVAVQARRVYPALNLKFRWLAALFEARSYDGRLEDQHPLLYAIFNELCSARFTQFVESVTGIPALEADGDLLGAGLHQGTRGSYLRVHADHNTHPNETSRFRRVNVLIYLNGEWLPQWNGDLELWDRQARSCQKRISPAFNRCVILRVDDSAFHGYGPLRTPRGETRKALAMYLYSAEPAAEQDATAHHTIWPELGREHPLTTFIHWIRRGTMEQLSQAFRFKR